MKCDIWVLFENPSWKLNVVSNLTIITSTLHEDLRTFMITSRWIRHVSDNSCTEHQTHILCSLIFFSENRAVYEMTYKNMAEPDRPHIDTSKFVRYAMYMPDTYGKNTHIHKIWYFVFHNWLIRSDLINFFASALTKTAQRLLYHYDLFIRFVRVKMVMSK